MKIGFRNANPSQGGESYYITVEDPLDGQTACLLVDSGSGVSVERDLANDEYLAGILLTHAHLDHYRTLGGNIVDGAAIHTSPSTAAIAETVYREGERNYDLSGTEAVVEALHPVEGWHEIRNDIAIHSIPAGHAPGATGFVIRVLDGSRATYALVTGDFGVDRVAGYPGLPTELPVDIDMLFVNGATDDRSTATEIVRTALERARNGSTVLVTTGGLSGVEYAYLLGHAVDHLGDQTPVRVVGQIAKLYEDLAFGVPNVESVATFSDPADVLDAGGITLAGPEVPIDGSAKRLFERIEDDPAATLLQIGSSNEPPVESAGCTLYNYRHRSHPPVDAIDALVDSLVPVHTVVCHGNRDRFKDRYDATFLWTDSTNVQHTLYADGDWREPPWIDESVSDLIRESYNRKRGSRIGDIFDESDPGLPDLPTPCRETSPDLVAEGLDPDALGRRETPIVAGISTPEGGSDSGMDRAERPTVSGSNGPEAPVTPRQEDEVESADRIEANDIERVLDRLDEIDAHLRNRSVRVRVIDAGDGDVLFRALEDVDLEHGEELTISLPT